MPQRRGAKAPDKRKGRPRFWLSLLLLMLVLVLAGMGKWDLVLAVFIGLTVGNVASWIYRLD